MTIWGYFYVVFKKSLKSASYPLSNFYIYWKINLSIFFMLGKSEYIYIITIINAGQVNGPPASDKPSPYFGTGPVTINSPATLFFNRNTLTNRITLNGALLTGGNSFSTLFRFCPIIIALGRPGLFHLATIRQSGL